VSRKWRNWYQNEVNEETKGVDPRDKVKHNERSDLLFLESKRSETTGKMIIRLQDGHFGPFPRLGDTDHYGRRYATCDFVFAFSNGWLYLAWLPRY